MRSKLCSGAGLAVVGVLACGVALAADLEVKDVAWIAGNWRGAVGTHGIVEENWTAPLGGSMTGTARVVSMSKVQFYEMLVIEATEEGPMLRMKHYSPGLDGWEDKDDSFDYLLSSVSGTRAEFRKAPGNPPDRAERITYERTPGDTLIITIHDSPPQIVRMGLVGSMPVPK